MPCLLLLPVPLGAAADPHINHLPAHHPAQSLLQSKDHFERSSVYTPYIRSQAHELHQLAYFICSLVWSVNWKNNGQALGVRILAIVGGLTVQSYQVVRVKTVCIGWVAR